MQQSLKRVQCSAAGLLAPLAAGGTVIIPAGGKFSAGTFWRDATEHGATYYTAVPTMHQVSGGLCQVEPCTLIGPGNRLHSMLCTRDAAAETAGDLHAMCAPQDYVAAQPFRQLCHRWQLCHKNTAHQSLLAGRCAAIADRLLQAAFTCCVLSNVL